MRRLIFTVEGRAVHIGSLVPQLDYTAPQPVRDVVASLGRTEDVKFSPSKRRLALAEYWKNRITVFEISITASPAAKSIALTGATQISSAYFDDLHGLDFIDDERILTANRKGQACIFQLPNRLAGSHELAPLASLSSAEISTPGSVAVVRKQGCYEALICNNYVHTVTRHRLDFGAGHSITSGEVFLERWLDIPDGICLSEELEWIAVSNHNTHSVFLYENKPSLNGSAEPIGILRRIKYPHGLRFTADGRFIFVADAGSPFVNIYEKGGSDWRGVHNPLLSIRVVNDDDFLRGRGNRAEGGPKGIDIHDATNTLVTTCESQPLAFFDLTPILQRACQQTSVSNDSIPEARLLDRKARDVRYELHRGRIQAAVIVAVEWVKDKVPALGWVLRAARMVADRKLLTKSY